MKKKTYIICIINK